MSDSLRDQLLKAGLTTEQDVKRVQTEKSLNNRKRKHTKKSQRSGPSEAELHARHEAERKRERDRELNQQRDAENRRKANEKAARELVIKSEIAHGKDGDVAFHFERDGRIKHIYVSPDQQKQLAEGTLAIARTRGHYRLVPKEVAERVKPMAPFLIVFESDGGSGEDDPMLEEFPIPDDLMW
jgi:hypothetical protein